jgi:predicted HNH restriction endonuclease
MADLENGKLSTPNGRASICTWELEFYFRREDQIRKFIELLLKEDFLFNFQYEQSFDETSTIHRIFIEGSWANNLAKVANLAEEVDYKVGP